MHKIVVLAATTALLTACGGGSDNSSAASQSEDPLARVPASAEGSVAGMVAYLELLGKNKDNDRESIGLDGVELPTSDTTEPTALQ
jgi:hypothetical protein